jgi:hypothetical protein
MTATAAITHLPQTLLAHDFGVRIKARGKGDLGRGVRDRFRKGTLPGPIDADLPTNQWRWSEAVVTNYTDGLWKSA